MSARDLLDEAAEVHARLRPVLARFSPTDIHTLPVHLAHALLGATIAGVEVAMAADPNYLRTPAVPPEEAPVAPPARRARR